jgi:hypothetical protein
VSARGPPCPFPDPSQHPSHSEGRETLSISNRIRRAAERAVGATARRRYETYAEAWAARDVVAPADPHQVDERYWPGPDAEPCTNPDHEHNQAAAAEGETYAQAMARMTGAEPAEADADESRNAWIPGTYLPDPDYSDYDPERDTTDISFDGTEGRLSRLREAATAEPEPETGTGLESQGREPGDMPEHDMDNWYDQVDNWQENYEAGGQPASADEQIWHTAWDGRRFHGTYQTLAEIKGTGAERHEPGDGPGEWWAGPTDKYPTVQAWVGAHLEPDAFPDAAGPDTIDRRREPEGWAALSEEQFDLDEERARAEQDAAEQEQLAVYGVIRTPADPDAETVITTADPWAEAGQPEAASEPEAGGAYEAPWGFDGVSQRLAEEKYDEGKPPRTPAERDYFAHLDKSTRPQPEAGGFMGAPVPEDEAGQDWRAAEDLRLAGEREAEREANSYPERFEEAYGQDPEPEPESADSEWACPDLDEDWPGPEPAGEEPGALPRGVTPVVNDRGAEIHVVDPAQLGDFLADVNAGVYGQPEADREAGQ